jgi:hypothetical protein
MDAFPIRLIDRRRAQDVEPLGSKPKFWFRDDGQRVLFKADDRGTGEDWAEIVAAELCRLLGIPHVAYSLAVECEGSRQIRPGVICPNMSPPPKSLVLGNQLLLAFDPAYPHRQRFKVQQHTFEAVCRVLSTLGPPESEWITDSPPGIRSALDVFVRYVLLDVWIANQDRHHENWGAIWTSPKSPSIVLAPTFDHGAGLARNLTDSEREERLTTRDRNRSLPTFAAKGRSALYESQTASKPLLLLEAFQRFSQRSPLAAKNWLERLATVTRDQVAGILARIPAERMSECCRRFTLELLEFNRRRLLEWERI